MRKYKQLNAFWIFHLIQTTNFLDLIFPQRGYEIKGYRERNRVLTCKEIRGGMLEE